MAIITDYLDDRDSLNYLQSEECIPYTPEEEIKMFKRFKLSDGAEKNELRNEIAMHNQKLVASIAKKYMSSLTISFSLEDMVNEGNIGLLSAIDKFDNSAGYKFSTYATWWIKQAILRSYTQKSNFIRVPDNLKPLWLKIIKFTDDYYSKFYDTPSDEEIIKNIKGVDKNILQSFYLYSDVLKNTISLNLQINSEDSKDTDEIQDFIIDDGISVEDEAIKNISAIDFENQIDKMLVKAIQKQILTERDVEIFKKRFGFGVNDRCTLQTLGNEYNVSKERIRRIECKTIRFLQKPQNKYELRKYMYQ